SRCEGGRHHHYLRSGRRSRHLPRGPGSRKGERRLATGLRLLPHCIHQALVRRRQTGRSVRPEMSVHRRPEVLFAIVLGAFVLHAALADNLQLWGARPNLTVVALLICSLYTGPGLGAGLGFFAGLLEASYLPVVFGSLLATRIAAGVAVGSLEY